MYSTDEKRHLVDTNLDDKPAESATQPEPSRGQNVLLMLSCLFLQFASSGMSMSLGVIYVELIDAFNAPRSEAALVQSLYLGISLGGGILFSGIISRFDVGKCVICSSIIGTTCLIGSSFAPNLNVIIVLIGLVLGLSQSFNLLASYAVINWAFTKSRKSALAFLTLGQAVAQLAVPLLTETLVDRYSWDGTFFILSAIMSFQGIPMGIVIYTSGSYFRKDGTQSTPQSDVGTIPMYKDAQFIFFLTGHVMFSILSPVEQWFSVDLAVMKGFTTDNGAALLSINGICGLVGRLSGTFLLHRFSGLAPDLFVAASVLFWGIAHVCVINANVYLFLALGMVLRGFSAGHFWSFLPAFQIELRGVKQYPQTVAFCSFLAGTSQIIGGFLGGLTADVTGGYDFIFYLATGTSVYASFCFVIVFILRKGKKKQIDNENGRQGSRT